MGVSRQLDSEQPNFPDCSSPENRRLSAYNPKRRAGRLANIERTSKQHAILFGTPVAQKHPTEIQEFANHEQLRTQPAESKKVLQHSLRLGLNNRVVLREEDMQKFRLADGGCDGQFVWISGTRHPYLKVVDSFSGPIRALTRVFGQGCRRRNFERIIHTGAHYISVVSPLTGDGRAAILKTRWSSEGWLTFEARPSA